MIGEAELRAYYEAYEEEGRLATRHGSVEFLTTVRYVERYLRPGMRLLEIGAGARPVSSIAEIFASGCRANAGLTVPAQGLCLMEVQYH